MTFTFLLKCLYFYLPVALANIGANIGKYIPAFRDIKTPIDFGKTYKGKRLVGVHKNWGSFLFGVVFGTLIGIVKFRFFDNEMSDYILLKLNFTETIFLYFIMSTSALFGDIIKSIAKRLLNRPAHSAWIPFDEIDHSTASMFVAAFFFPISAKAFLTVVVLYFFLHMLSNLTGYAVGLKDVPY